LLHLQTCLGVALTSQNKFLREKFVLTTKPSRVLILLLSICRVVHNRTEFCGEAQMNKNQELLNAIVKSPNGKPGSDDIKRLTCAEAFELAKNFETEIIEIGHICNQHNIRICKCQLGCFT